MKNLDAELKEMIAKQMPSLQAKALQDYIEEAELNKQLLNKKEDEIKLLTLNLKETSLQRDGYALEVSLAKAVIEREDKLIQDQQTLELDKLKFKIEKDMITLQATEADKRSSLMQGFLTTLVKNPISEEYFRESKYAPGSTTYHKDGTYTSHNSGDIIQEREQKIERKKE